MKNLLAIMDKFLTYKKLSHASILCFVGLLAFSSFILASSTFTANAAQSALTGEWVAQPDSKKPGSLNMMLSRRTEKSSFFMKTNSFSLDELQGLPLQAVSSSAKTIVNFRIAREAGTFECEGYFGEGKGAGFWTLVPNQAFVSMLRGRGYDNLSDEDLLRAALHDLTTKFIEDWKSAGYNRLEFEQIIRAKSHNITPQFIGKTQSAGFQNLTMDELIRAKNHNIDGEFVKKVQAIGFERQSLDTLIRIRNHNITPEFVSQMRSAGFENLSVEQLIRLKNHSVTAEFVSDLKAEGYAAISSETAIRLKNYKIDRDFIRRAKAKGYSDVSLEELIRLRNRSIIN